MALSRWSFSPWYIYETANDELSIDCCGTVSQETLNENFVQVIDNLITIETTPMARLELIFYLKIWLQWKNNQITNLEFNKKLEKIRNFGYRRNYLYNGEFPSFWRDYNGGIPRNEVVYYLENSKKQEKMALEKKQYIKRKTNKDCQIQVITLIGESEYGYTFQFQHENGQKVTFNKNKIMIDKHYTEYPIIVGESYRYDKKNEIIYNDFKESKKTENNQFWEEQIKLYQDLIEKHK